MYIVIFRAQIKQLDDDYYTTAQRMRALAINDYGCVEFTSALEDGQEIALSYWNNEADIARWKQDPQHRQAQQLGVSRWYWSYHVEVVNIIRHYRHPAD